VDKVPEAEVVLVRVEILEGQVVLDKEMEVVRVKDKDKVEMALAKVDKVPEAEVVIVVLAVVPE
jgi:hypothetical protein